MHAPEVPNHIDMERDALRLLCSVLIKPVTRVALCGLLRPENFIEPLQRIIFEEISSLGAVDSKQLVQLLPSRVTNRGFPDFDLEDLLTPKLVSEKEIERLFQSVLRLIELHESNEESEPA